VNSTWTGAGKYGSALLFNGTNALVTIPDAASLRLTTAMTLEAWVNPSTTSSGWRDVIYKGNDNYLLEGTSQSAGAPAGGGVIGGSSTTFVYGAAALSINTWTHLALTYDGANVRLYINGVQVSAQAITGNLATSANPLQIGGDSLFGQYFSGIIDEVRVYNVALTPGQIHSDMGTPIGTAMLPAVIVSPSSILFTNQTLGTSSASQPVTVMNTGTIALAITGLSITGFNPADFSQTNNCPSSLLPNASCIVNVRFSPTAVGTRAATLAIANNAPGNPHTVALNGTGIAGFSIFPRVTVLTFTQTQQFTAAGSPLTWLVDGVVGGAPASGTVSNAGLYTPPNSLGTHTVTVTDGVQSASATVYISNHPGVFTYHNDNSRTGQNAGEMVLSPANVNATQFGKLFSYSLDGQPNASPLYVANVNIPGQGFHNVVYVATEHDTVYALDADGLSGNPLWTKSFLSSGVTTVPANDTGECCDIAPEIGITSTPVIDQATNTLYAVAKTKEGGNYVQRLHALDITTGAEKFGGPVVIQASVPGSGTGAQGGQVPFNALRENQRPALLLSNGVVYMAWAAHGDQQPWHGWVMGYNATTLQQTMAFNVSPNGYGGGIWQSGGGLGTDSTGNIYFTTANGDFNASTGGTDYGDSVLKLSPTGGVVDYFTPHDQANMEALNIDLASAGPVLLLDQPGPNPHLLITGGKGGSVYVINRDNMGHFNSANDNNIIQTLVNIFPNGVPEPGNYSAPVYFNGTVYFSPVNDTLQAFRLSNGTLSLAPTSRTSLVYAYPGGAFSVSANGTANGILWAVQRAGGSVTSNTDPGTLHAYDASNLATELYNSDQAGSRDTLDIAMKFNVPLVVNGKVFVATNSKLMVYGLLP
jgi:hypothetical protein